MLPLDWPKQQAAGEMTVIYRHVKMMSSFDMSLKLNLCAVITLLVTDECCMGG
jgi:hypothetical protein